MSPGSCVSPLGPIWDHIRTQPQVLQLPPKPALTSTSEISKTNSPQLGRYSSSCCSPGKEGISTVRHSKAGLSGRTPGHLPVHPCPSLHSPGSGLQQHPLVALLFLPSRPLNWPEGHQRVAALPHQLLYTPTLLRPSEHSPSTPNYIRDPTAFLQPSCAAFLTLVRVRNCKPSISD